MWVIWDFGVLCNIGLLFVSFGLLEFCGFGDLLVRVR